jgi:hypothetical protein
MDAKDFEDGCFIIEEKDERPVINGELIPILDAECRIMCWASEDKVKAIMELLNIGMGSFTREE